MNVSVLTPYGKSEDFTQQYDAMCDLEMAMFRSQFRKKNEKVINHAFDCGDCYRISR